jgi:hypothetical protein
MNGDRIEMSQRERDRLKVMAPVLEGGRTQEEAARLLKLCVRQVRRIQRRLEVDFPKQTPLPEKVKQQNDQLGGKFGVEGYPTIILLGPAGAEIGKLGYETGGPGPYIEKIKGIVKSQK